MAGVDRPWSGTQHPQADKMRFAQQDRATLEAAFIPQADASPNNDRVPTIAAKATRGNRS